MKRKLRIKVCGLRETGNSKAVAALGVDYLGFIFYAGSPRFVGDRFAMPQVGPGARVGVFVNESPDRIQRLAERHDLDVIQLHGDESVEDCRAIREAGLKVIKAISVGHDMDFSVTVPFGDVVDYFLFDTKGTYRGGNARPFDWRVLDRYNDEKPFFLSGGIRADNVAGVRALLDKNIHAIDINSGVELAPGMKDVEKIRSVQELLDLML